MQGNIDFTGTLSGSIADSGGGGSDVTITPTLQSGTKIADYTIDSESGSLYAPTPERLTAELPLDISNNNISIDLSDYLTETEIVTFYATKSEVTAVDIGLTQYVDGNFQRKLTAGNNISIDANNVISASGGTWDYSTSEVNTGQKWVDGRTIYIKTIELTGINFNISQNNFKRANIELHPYIPEAEIGWIVDDASYILEILDGTYYYRNFDFWEWEGDSTLTTQYVGLFKRDTAVDQTVILTIKYVKGSV